MALILARFGLTGLAIACAVFLAIPLLGNVYGKGNESRAVQGLRAFAVE